MVWAPLQQRRTPSQPPARPGPCALRTVSLKGLPKPEVSVLLLGSKQSPLSCPCCPGSPSLASLGAQLPSSRSGFPSQAQRRQDFSHKPPSPSPHVFLEATGLGCLPLSVVPSMGPTGPRWHQIPSPLLLLAAKTGVRSTGFRDELGMGGSTRLEEGPAVSGVLGAGVGCGQIEQMKIQGLQLNASFGRKNECCLDMSVPIPAWGCGSNTRLKCRVPAAGVWNRQAAWTPAEPGGATRRGTP